MATVARFNITPVKSTALQHPDVIVVTDRGVEGDHRFLLLETDGRRPSTEAKGGLLSIRTSFDVRTDRLTVSFPDGEVIEARAASHGEPTRVQLYDREVQGRFVEGPIAEAMSRRLDRAIRLVRVDEPEYAGGRHRLSIVSLASVDDLGRRAGLDGELDPRRFRMTVELAGCEPYEEDSWTGRVVRVGETALLVGDGVARCALTTMHPETGDKDVDTLGTLARYRRRGSGLLFGVYADVVEGGRIRLGDAVETVT